MKSLHNEYLSIATNIKEERIDYQCVEVNMTGFLAYDASLPYKKPLIILIHEWWGLNDYIKSRARQFAHLGYCAFAIDIYGNGQVADNPTDAGKLAEPFYKDTLMTKAHFDAALEKVVSLEVADTRKTIALGYCFGGGMALNMARLGANIHAAVSIHGSLSGVSKINNKINAAILVCHGEDDKFIDEAEVQGFKAEMKAVGAEYYFKSYAGATHAFSNPNATAMGEKFNLPIAYNELADKESWKDIIHFLDQVLKSE